MVLVHRLSHKLVFKERNKNANSSQTMRKWVSYAHQRGKPYKVTVERGIKVRGVYTAWMDLTVQISMKKQTNSSLIQLHSTTDILDMRQPRKQRKAH